MGVQFAGNILVQTNGGPLPISLGGTGQTTAPLAINALVPSQSGNAGKVLTTNGSVISWTSSASTPGGADTQIQYNDSGTFGGNAFLVLNKSTGAITSTSTLTNRGLVLNNAAANVRQVSIQTAASNRWAQGADAVAETGSNAGSNYFFSRVADNGSTTNSVFTIARASGVVDFKVQPTVNGVAIGGASTGTSGQIQLADGSGGFSVGTGFTWAANVLSVGDTSSTSVITGGDVASGVNDGSILYVRGGNSLLGSHSNGGDLHLEGGIPGQAGALSPGQAGNVYVTGGLGGANGISTTNGGNVFIAGGLAGSNGATGAGGYISLTTAPRHDSAFGPVERLRVTALGEWQLAGSAGTSGQVFTSGGAGVPPTWSAASVGTVTSVAVSGGTTGLTTSGGPVTGSGTITLAGALITANGGTGATNANAGFNNLAPSQTGNSGKYLTSDGTNTSWSVIVGGGTVTSVSVATANGFAGTVATSTSTPAITLSTTVTGLLQGNGTSVAAASSANVITALGYTPVNRAGDTLSGTLTFSAGTITGIPTPTTGTDVTNKNYVDSAITGLTWKTAVLAATTANITLSAPQTIDGVAVVAGNRVLVKNQTAGQDNGIYLVAAGAWTRALDADSPSELDSAAVFIQQGTTLADTGWTQTATIVTVGTTVQTWIQFTGSGSYTAGTGLSLTGNTFANTGVLSNVAGTGISVSGATGNVTINVTAAPALTLSGTVLATGVVTSSLTSVGTLSGLAVTGTTTHTGTTNFAGAASPILMGGSPGTSGFVLTSAGAGVTPTWTAAGAAGTALTGTQIASNIVQWLSSTLVVGTTSSPTITTVINQTAGTFTIAPGQSITGGASGTIMSIAGGQGQGTGGVGGGGALNLTGGAIGSGSSLSGGAVNITGGSGFNVGGAINIAGGTAFGGVGGPIALSTAPGGGAVVERLRILNNGAWSVGTAGTNTGTSGQVLASTGATTAPAWTTTTVPYDFSFFVAGLPTANQIVYSFVTPRVFTTITNFTGSFAKATVAATASTVFGVNKNGSSIGTITFAAAATTGTFTVTSTAFAAGDVLSIIAPASPDVTLANLSITILQNV